MANRYLCIRIHVLSASATGIPARIIIRCNSFGFFLMCPTVSDCVRLPCAGLDPGETRGSMALSPDRKPIPVPFRWREVLIENLLQYHFDGVKS